MERREFLKKCGVVAAGLGVVPVVVKADKPAFGSKFAEDGLIKALSGDDMAITGGMMSEKMYSDLRNYRGKSCLTGRQNPTTL